MTGGNPCSPMSAYTSRDMPSGFFCFWFCEADAGVADEEEVTADGIPEPFVSVFCTPRMSAMSPMLLTFSDNAR